MTYGNHLLMRQNGRSMSLYNELVVSIRSPGLIHGVGLLNEAVWF